MGVMALYPLHIRRTATELVNSASRIRSDQEARRAIDEWKRRLPGHYSAAPDGNVYGLRIGEVYRKTIARSRTWPGRSVLRLEIKRWTCSQLGPSGRQAIE